MCTEAHRASFGFLLGTVGTVFVVSGLTLWFAVGRPQTAQLNQAVLGIIVHVLFGYIVVMGAVVLVRSDLSVMQCFVTTTWSLGGAAFMGVFVLWRAIPEIRSGSAGLELLNELVIITSVGAAAGVLVGLNRGQAVRNRRLVSKKEDREETLVFLLRLLDHDIQNHLVAISNHANSVRPSTFDPSPTPSEAIEERAASIEGLLDTANVVLEAETGDRDLERVNISPILREEVAITRSNAPDVEIEADIDDRLSTRADRFLGEVFQNILDNAVAHNPTDDLTISVSTTVENDSIEITIADDGAGIAPSIRETLFDPGVQRSDSSGDGMGLYLVAKLLEDYSGGVSVADRSPTGTAFRIRLPHWDDSS